MKQYSITTLIVACLLGVAGPASATAISSISFSNLTITLTDLNPDDGIAPSMSFMANGKAYVFGETRSWGDSYEKHNFQHYAKQQQGTLSGSVHDSWATSSASVTAADTLAGFTALSASGIADSGADANGYFRSYATGADPFLNQFILSANTRLTVTTHASMQVQTTIGYNLEADMGEQASANLMFGLIGYTFDGIEQSNVQQRGLSAQFNVRDDGSIEGVSDSWSGELSSSFVNATGFDATGTFQAFVRAEGTAAVQAVEPSRESATALASVPEPTTLAMLLPGMALLGLTRRRRRS